MYANAYRAIYAPVLLRMPLKEITGTDGQKESTKSKNRRKLSFTLVVSPRLRLPKILFLPVNTTIRAIKRLVQRTRVGWLNF